jgi:hypothetical protein
MGRKTRCVPPWRPHGSVGLNIVLGESDQPKPRYAFPSRTVGNRPHPVPPFTKQHRGGVRDARMHGRAPIRTRQGSMFHPVLPGKHAPVTITRTRTGRVLTFDVDACKRAATEDGMAVIRPSSLGRGSQPSHAREAAASPEPILGMGSGMAFATAERLGRLHDHQFARPRRLSWYRRDSCRGPAGTDGRACGRAGLRGFEGARR